MRRKKGKIIKTVKFYSLWFLLIGVIIVLLSRFAVWDVINSGADRFTSWYMGAVTNTKQSFNRWFTGDYPAEIIRLEAEIASLQEEQNEIDLLREENDFLRQQLNIIPQKNIERAVFGRIIGEKPLSLSRTYIIDKGWKDGILQDYPVIAGGQMVGIITFVDERTAEMTMVTDPTTYVHAYIQDTDSYGLTHGQLGSATLILEEISKETEINVGDLVFASGQNNILWQDLVLGEVTEVIIDNRTTYQSAVVKPLVNLSAVKEVMILST